MSTGSDAGGSAAAKPKRARTERRAQQNRAAQKRYRDKLKQRNEQLASFAAKYGFNPDADDTTSESSCTRDTTHGRVQGTEIVPFSPARTSGVGTGSNRAAWRRFDSLDQEQLTALVADGGGADEANESDVLLEQFEQLAADSRTVKNRRLMLEHCFHVLGLNVVGAKTTTLTKLASLQGVNLREILLTGVRVMVRQGLIPTQLSDLYPKSESPQAHNLRFRRFATLDALLSNAMSMGFDIANLYKVHHPSPFYRPDIKSAADIQGPTADYFMGIAPHLRPTSVQIRCWHKTWIDLIPFPVLRMRIILATNKSPPAIDPWELKHDVMHDGLTFVGASGSDEGEPWDMRSWKIAPWFIKKYKPFLTEEQLELGGQIEGF